MRRTIREKLTVSIVCIVFVLFTIIVITTVSFASNKLINDQKNELQLQSDKYAEQINTWFKSMIILAEESAKDISNTGNMTRGDYFDRNLENIRRILKSHIKGHEEAFNMYYVREDSKLCMADAELKKTIPKDFLAAERPWYLETKKQERQQ